MMPTPASNPDPHLLADAGPFSDLRVGGDLRFLREGAPVAHLHALGDPHVLTGGDVGADVRRGVDVRVRSERGPWSDGGVAADASPGLEVHAVADRGAVADAAVRVLADTVAEPGAQSDLGACAAGRSEAKCCGARSWSGGDGPKRRAARRFGALEGGEVAPAADLGAFAYERAAAHDGVVADLDLLLDLDAGAGADLGESSGNGPDAERRTEVFEETDEPGMRTLNRPGPDGPGRRSQRRGGEMRLLIGIGVFVLAAGVGLQAQIGQEITEALGRRLGAIAQRLGPQAYPTDDCDLAVEQTAFFLTVVQDILANVTQLAGTSDPENPASARDLLQAIHSTSRLTAVEIPKLQEAIVYQGTACAGDQEP